MYTYIVNVTGFIYCYRLYAIQLMYSSNIKCIQYSTI